MKKKKLHNRQEDMKFYNSPRWKHVRAAILRRDGYRCQISKQYGKIEEATVVHHIFPREAFPQYQFEAWNLISLTHLKHMELHEAASGALSPAGIDLLRKTARKNNIPIPEQFR